MFARLDDRDGRKPKLGSHETNLLQLADAQKTIHLSTTSVTAQKTEIPVQKLPILGSTVSGVGDAEHSPSPFMAVSEIRLGNPVL